ncbi:hypothetical protein JEZ13_01820 [bacterium]|nr:hypothetical protein [bacterium]
MEIKSKKVFFSLLFIIFAFQIAFVGVVVYYFATHKVVFVNTQANEIKADYRELKDNRPEIHSKYRDNIYPLRDQNRDLRVKFMTELTKPEPNYETLSELNIEIQKITQEISKNFYNEMIETRKTFTPEEAKRFFGQHLRMMKNRFDQDMPHTQMGHHPQGEQRRARTNNPNYRHNK